MLQSVRAFLNRPLSEDFSLRHQAILSAQATGYVFIFLFLFMGGNGGNNYPRWLVLGTLAISCGLTSLVANVAVPALFPVYYDEERWTVKRHSGHVLLVLFFVAVGNQAVLWLLGLNTPPFLLMYLIVTAVGFFPVSLGIMLAERRRLKRNLEQAQQLNQQLDRLHNVPTAPPAETVLPRSISLVSESGKDRLNLLPNQLIYVESVGNYVEVHWLNFMFPQKTVLRSTLKDVEAALVDQPQFFRCHRAFIVNLRAVSYTTGNARGYQLTMSGSNREIPVSRTYVAAFDARLAAVISSPDHP